MSCSKAVAPEHQAQRQLEMADILNMFKTCSHAEKLKLIKVLKNDLSMPLLNFFLELHLTQTLTNASTGSNISMESIDLKENNHIDRKQEKDDIQAKEYIVDLPVTNTSSLSLSQQLCGTKQDDQDNETISKNESNHTMNDKLMVLQT